MKMSKRVLIGEEEVAILEQVKQEQSFITDRAALSYLIGEYERLSKEKTMMEKVVRKVLLEQLEILQPTIERIKWASSEAEKNSIMILDSLNATLIYQDMRGDCLVEEAEAKVIRKSRGRIKEKISHFKQKKDERNARK